VWVGTCNAATTSTNLGNITYTLNGVANNGPWCTGGTNSDGTVVQAGAVTGFYTRMDLDTTAFGVGTVDGFPQVTSSVVAAATIAAGAQFGATRLIAFVDGTAYRIIINNCPAGNGDCVQAVINWWRCHGFIIDSATFCFRDVIVPVACPTILLGFNCPSSSKKGLLGLLGLLGIIPLVLCLLLCCLILPCFCRRTKREGDVHFATFDPHAAPIAGSVAPGSCMAPSIGGPMCY
jgi:hypothetical protein